MLRSPSVRVVLVALAAGVSVTCGGDGAGPDPNAVASVVITPNGTSLDTGDSLQLTATAHSASGAILSGKTFVWSTLDPTQVTVSGGLVHAHWPGIARVVATSEQRADTAQVQVVARIDSLVLTPSLDTLRSLGEQLNLSVVPYIGTQAYSGGQLTWVLSDTSVLSLSVGVPTPQAATVGARKNGSTIVRVHEARGAADSSVIVVRQRVAQIVPYGFPLTQLYRACATAALVAALDARGNQVANAALQWRSSDTTRARVDSSGLITPLALGVDTIVVTSDTATLRMALSIVAAPAMTLQLAGPGVAAVNTVGRELYVLGTGLLSGATGAPARFRIASSDTAIAAIAPVDTAVPMFSQQGGALRVVGRNHGTVSLTPYLCDVPGPTVSLRVTTPRLTLIDTLPAEARSDDPPKSVAIFLQDSTGITDYAAVPLTVRLATTDTAVMQSDSSARHLGVGSTSFGITVTYRDTGVARLVAADSAAVYRPDTSGVVKVVYPPLFLIADTMHLGMRQLAFSPSDPHYVYIDRNVPAPLAISLTSSDTTIGRITPTAVNILPGLTAAPIVVTGGEARGIATLTAHAARHRDTTSVVVVSRPAASSIPFVGIFYVGDTLYYQVVTTDSATGASHAVAEPVTFTVASTDPTVLTLDSTTLTVPVGSALSALTPVILKKTGTASITASDPRAVPYSYLSGSSPVTVTQSFLQADSVLSVGLDQGAVFEIVVNGPLHGQAVHVAHNNPAAVSLADTVAALFVPGLAVVSAFGVSLGLDSVIASAPGFTPDTGTIVVGLGTGDLATWPSGLTVGQTWPLQLNILAPNGDPRLTAVNKTFTLTANGNIDFLQDTVPITTVTVLVNNQFSSPFVVRGKAAGTGTVTISAPNYAPVTKSVTVTP